MMVPLLPLAAYSLVLLQALVAGFPLAHTDVPRYFKPNPITRRDLTPNTVISELGPRLSQGTLIFGPSSPAFANATSRWITYIQPDIEVVVEVGAESDISKVVSNLVPCRKHRFAEYGRRSSIATITASNSSQEVVDMEEQ